MLGCPLLYLRGTRVIMFKLSGFCYRSYRCLGFRLFSGAPAAMSPDATKGLRVSGEAVRGKPTVLARKLEHHYPHALKVEHKKSQQSSLIHVPTFWGSIWEFAFGPL